ncbi:glycoside hydrolase family 3 N-terminal domain-containing protein [Polymorphospora rubra]|uniref:beta-glucosidase n=1 Tax=Polymorphospora rubra TaxID=338584 RepID=A0A810N9A4_9ACTN|nr:beta-glucosidase [Polymorphospora rubra]
MPGRAYSKRGTAAGPAGTVTVVDGPPYRNARLPVAVRVEDLLHRMTLPEKAGLLFHTMVGIGPAGSLAPDDPDAGLLSAAEMVRGRRMSHFNLLGTAGPADLARWHNRLQELAASTRLGIPVTVSSDPRHAYSANPNTAALAGAFSVWPEPLGMAATRDAALVRGWADVIRQEYAAVGIRVALHPQADLATEPRWPRTLGTFGEDAGLAAELVRAYVGGLQGPVLGPDGVAAMVKHFPGGGATHDGEDPHFRYGREQVYPGGRFADHLRPFVAALDAGCSQVMLGYGMPRDTGYEEVGFSFNRDVVGGLLRRRMGFGGIVCTDWGVLTGAAFRGQVRPARAWGLERLSPAQRARRVLDAGADQIGGEAVPGLVVDLVRTGQVGVGRLDASVRRVLREKFTLGLFDRPYVDPDRAARVVGCARFRAAGLAAQRACVTLLSNAAPDRPAHLPLRPGLRIWCDGMDPAVVARDGRVVARPADADVAILRLQAPYDHRPGQFEAFFHAGSLEFAAGEMARVLAIAAAVPTVVDVYLDRPAVLPRLAAGVDALVVSFGVGDEALMDVLAGRAAPRGRLPFDLPRSSAAVRAGRPDVAFDTADPVFRFGHGLTY